MKHQRTIILLALAGIAAAVAGCSSDSGTAAKPGKLWWHRSLPGAMLEARERGSLILVKYYTNEESWLESPPPADENLRDLLANFTLLRLSAYEHRNNPEMLFGLTRFPALLVLNSRGQMVHARNDLPSGEDYAAFLAEAAQKDASAAVASTVSAALPTAGTAITELRWHSSPEEAFAEARRRGRPTLMLFVQPNCPPCQLLETQTLLDPGVQALLGNFTLLKSDTGADPAFRLKHDVEGTPTTVILGEDGRRLAAQSGYAPPQKYAQLLASALQGQGTDAPPVGSTGEAEPSATRTALAWHSTLEAATGAASRRNTIVVALFSDPACAHSARLLGTTFSDSAVRNAMADFELLKLDATNVPDLAKRFGVTGTPTSVALDANGDALAIQRGFVEPQQYLRFLASAMGPGGTGLEWHTTLQDALAAGENGKPILACFIAPGCSNSRKLLTETLANQAVRGRLAEFVLLKVNAAGAQGKSGSTPTDDAATAAAYGVKATPVSMILDANGVPVVVQRGYVPPERYLEFLAGAGNAEK